MMIVTTIREAWLVLRRRFAPKRPSRRVVIALLAVVVLLILHPLLLRMLAWPLQAADSAAATTCYCLHGKEMGIDGFQALDRAAEWRQATGGTVLLILPQTSRIVEIGATPSFEQTCRRELAKRGVPGSDVQSLGLEAGNSWDEARALAGWLKQHPQATVSLACSPFASGRLRYIFNSVLGDRDGQRVRLVCLSDPTYPPSSWWCSQTGVKDFMYAWLDLLYARRDDSDDSIAQPSAAAFRDEVRARIAEAPQ